ncbi:MAG: hypothetical protein MJK12_07920 [Colwellia sp.]|nr:hypothetical protein [Colwellia sp.]
MKLILKSVCLLLCLILTSKVFATDCESTCQLKQVNTYFSALDKVSRKGSSIKDIDTLLALTHSEVKYIHVEYQANFDKKSWREAFIRNLKRGAYSKGKENEVRITNSIFGKNNAAIEYSNGIVQSDGSWQATKPRLVLFAFTEGKISLIKELW